MTSTRPGRRLADGERWDPILSGAERLLIQKPDIMMGATTSALDERSQDSLLGLIESELAHATVISVGDRPGLEDFQSRKITLEKREAGAQLTSKRLTKSFWRLFQRREADDDRSAA